MKVLFYTHRFGLDVVGGAEMHLWNLAVQMVRKGCEVDVVAPLAKGLSASQRFSIHWHDESQEPYSEVGVPGTDKTIRIFRFPVLNPPLPLKALYQKHLQRRWEAEEMAMEPPAPLDVPFHPDYPLLLTGWHPPELTHGKYLRWTMPRATLQCPPLQQAALHFQGFSPCRQTIRIEHEGKKRVVYKGRGNFQFSVKLDDTPHNSILALETSPTVRPLRDSRKLGAMISHLSLSNHGRIELAPFHADHRTIRSRDREAFVRTYVERAEARPRRYSWIFDALRGPRSRGMRQFLKERHQEYDWVLAGIFPFNGPVEVERLKQKLGFRLALLPLFHVDDDFYYWRHYLDAMRGADLCLSNSWYAHHIFYPSIGAKSFVAGAGVSKRVFRHNDVSGERFRKKYRIGPDEKMILSVGRKCGPKRYRTLVRAVEAIQSEAPCRLILIGPEEDNLPVASPHADYLGVVPQKDLVDAYQACDFFCLFSESESFGMVFIEAWMREKAVIGNRNCAPVSYLIQHEENGLLASDRDALQRCLIRLLQDPDLCRQYGKAGFELATNTYTWPAIADRILEQFQA